MNFSFSTSAYPELSLCDAAKKARIYGFNAIELDSVKKENYAPAMEEFSMENREKTVEFLAENNLRINVLNTKAVLSEKNNMSGILIEPYDYIDLAEKLGVPYVKVFGDKRTEPSINDEIDIYYILENLKQACAYAKPKEISILMETNGIFSDSRLLARVMSTLNCKNSGVVWNVANTVRYSKESPEQTVAILGKSIRHVIMTDSVIKNGTVIPQMMGKGDLPMDEAVRALKETAYNGDISIIWHPESSVPDSDTALPQFLYYIKNLNI